MTKAFFQKVKFLFILLLPFSSIASDNVNFNEQCNFNDFDKFVEPKQVKSININTHKYRKWTKNLLRAITDKNARDISQKYKKRFDATIIVDFDNRLSCYFEARIRINGDHRDHLDFAPSLDIELINGNINNVTEFKLFIPKTRFDGNEIFTTSLLKELGFLAPNTYYVEATLNDRKVKYILQEKVVKEFVESNGLREGPILEGDERFIFNAGLPFGLSRQSNEKWIKGGKSSLEISKYAVNKLNKLYLEFLLTEPPHIAINKNPFRSESLSSQEVLIEEAQGFSAMLIALEASHALRPHNRKFYFDPLYKSFRPIYYDGMPSILENFKERPEYIVNAEEGFNYDEIIGSKFAFSVLKSMNRESFKQRLINSGLTDPNLEVDKILNSLLDRLTYISSLTPKKKSYEYQQYFSLKSDLEDGGLEGGLKLAFFAKDPFVVDVCNFKLSSCVKTKFVMNDYAKLISGKYISLDGKQYILIGNKDEYISGVEEEDSKAKEIVLNGQTSMMIFGETEFILDEENKLISFLQLDANSRVLFIGGNLNGWSIEFIGTNENFLDMAQRFDKNLLTGCLTFIDINITNSNINVKDTLCEDGVNFIRSSGYLASISVLNSFSDAIDADYSTLSFNNIYVENAVNDCLDFSSGVYKIKNALLIKCSDKGISGGEKTKLLINKVSISESNIGIASKDSSIIEVKEMEAQAVNTCFSAYRKKQEFWGGKIINNLHNCKSEKIFTEPGSTIISLD